MPDDSKILYEFEAGRHTIRAALASSAGRRISTCASGTNLSQDRSCCRPGRVFLSASIICPSSRRRSRRLPRPRLLQRDGAANERLEERHSSTPKTVAKRDTRLRCRKRAVGHHRAPLRGAAAHSRCLLRTWNHLARVSVRPRCAYGQASTAQRRRCRRLERAGRAIRAGIVRHHPLGSSPPDRRWRSCTRWRLGRSLRHRRPGAPRSRQHQPPLSAISCCGRGSARTWRLCPRQDRRPGARKQSPATAVGSFRDRGGGDGLGGVREGARLHGGQAAGSALAAAASNTQELVLLDLRAS